MHNLEKFEQLARIARDDSPPRVDVAADVVNSVKTTLARRVDSVDRMAVLFAAASILAASVVAMIAWRLVEEPIIAGVPNPFVVQVMASQ